jgi:hypothetical protein
MRHARVAVIALIAATTVVGCRRAKFRVAGNQPEGAIENEGDARAIPPDGSPDPDGRVLIKANDQEGVVSVPYGTDVTVTWSTSGVTGCQILPDGWKGESGKHAVKKVTSDQTYTATCIADDELVTSTVTILVSPAPVPQVNVTVNGKGGTTTAAVGDALDVAWTSRYADSCQLTPGAHDGAKGSFKATMTATALVYRVHCVGPGGTADDVAIVNVAPPPGLAADLKVNGTDVPVLVPYGSDVELDWTSSGAKSCKLDPSGHTDLNGSETLTHVTAAAVYVLTCIGDGGASVTDAVAINVDKAPMPTADLKANGGDAPYLATIGESVSVDWTSQFADDCTVDPGSLTGLSGQLMHVGNAAPASYSIRCTGPGGTAADTISILPSTTAPTADVTANGQHGAITVQAGAAVEIGWTSTATDQCTLSPTGQKTLSGKLATTAAATTTYTLRCSGAGGSVQTGVTVIVVTPGAVTAALTVDGSTMQRMVTTGTAVTVAWGSANATSCSLTPLGETALVGTRLTAALTTDTTFTLTCTGAGGTAKASVTVKVVPNLPPAVTLKANGSTGTVLVASDSTVTMTWQSERATSCVFDDSADSRPASGSRQVQRFSAGKKFKITCTGPGGTGTSTVDVQLMPPGRDATLIGINFEDLPVGARDGDYNDVVLCFQGQFRLDGTNVASTTEQSVTVTTSKISACNHRVRVDVVHLDGTTERPVEFQSQDRPVLSLHFRPGSVLEVTMQSSGGCTNDVVSMHDPDWAIVKADECRTTGI